MDSGLGALRHPGMTGMLVQRSAENQCNRAQTKTPASLPGFRIS
jgi:hypothetical protein